MRGQFGKINKAIDLIFKGKRLSKGKKQKKIYFILLGLYSLQFYNYSHNRYLISKLRKYIQVSQVGLSLNFLSQSEAEIKNQNKDSQFTLTVIKLVHQLYINLGKQGSILKLNITDSIVKIFVKRRWFDCKQLLSCLNRLLALLEFNKEAETTFAIFIDLIYKMINELNRDRTGMAQLTILSFLLTLRYQLHLLLMRINDKHFRNRQIEL